MNIGEIIKGHANELLGLSKDLAAARLAICEECPIYSPRLGGICNHKLWINPETEDVAINERSGYVQGCGCRLQAKTTLPNAKCIINKW